jgi:hypothetical protein
MVELLFWVWLSWIAINSSMFIAGVLFIKPQHPQFNGFRIHIPPHWLKELSADEIIAVVMHEQGHKVHLHVWSNLVRRFFFLPHTYTRRAKQELQADDYVTDPIALARALRKMSSEPFDLLRATRLEAKAVPMSGQPYARDARAIPPMGE